MVFMETYWQLVCGKNVAVCTRNIELYCKEFKQVTGFSIKYEKMSNDVYSIKLLVDTLSITNPVISGIDTNDYPDFSDAYLESGEINGRELTEEQLDFINSNCCDWVQEMAMKQIYGG